MRLEYEKGVLVARAESLEDIRTLLSFTPTKEQALTRHATRVQGMKYKKKCKQCEKRVLYMEAHVKTMHARHEVAAKA